MIFGWFCVLSALCFDQVLTLLCLLLTNSKLCTMTNKELVQFFVQISTCICSPFSQLKFCSCRGHHCFMMCFQQRDSIGCKSCPSSRSTVFRNIMGVRMQRGRRNRGQGESLQCVSVHFPQLVMIIYIDIWRGWSYGSSCTPRVHFLFQSL